MKPLGDDLRPFRAVLAYPLAVGVILLAVLLAGCAPPMSNDEIITEVQKCERAGLEAISYGWGWDMTTKRVECQPIRHELKESVSPVYATGGATADEAIEQIAAQIESTPYMQRMMSRQVLEDRRCYVFNDGGYECWLPEGVCEFRMPENLKPDADASGTMSCRAYGAVGATEISAAEIATDVITP